MIHIEQIRVQDEVQQLGVHTRTVHKSSLGSNCARHYWETQDMGGRGNSEACKDEVKISHTSTGVNIIHNNTSQFGSAPQGNPWAAYPREPV